MSGELDFAKSLQLFIKGVSGNTTVLHVKKDCSVDELMQKVAAEHRGIQPEELRLVFGGKQLEYGEGKSLADYRIQNLSTLFMVLRLRGGLKPLLATKMKKQEFTSLLGNMPETTSEACMITMDDDPSTKRAKMFCGHVIGPQSMSSYAHSLLSEGQYLFPCPYIDCKTNVRCGKSWEWFMVRHVATLSPEETQEFETMLGENYAKKAMGAQKCPGCTSFCLREDETDQCVRCPICSTKNGTSFDFCWSCMRKSAENKCTDPECDGADPRVRLLLQCPETEMGYTKIKVPSFRACPHCSVLITHLAGCKHMLCTGCKGKFCFVCLQKADQGGNYKCGLYNATCVVAPRQTQLD